MKKTHIPRYIYIYLKQQHQKTGGVHGIFRVPVPRISDPWFARVAARVVAKRMKVRTQVTKAKVRARPLNSPGGFFIGKLGKVCWDVGVGMKLFTKQLPGGWLIRDDANDKKSLFFLKDSDKQISTS